MISKCLLSTKAKWKEDMKPNSLQPELPMGYTIGKMCTGFQLHFSQSFFLTISLTMPSEMDTDLGKIIEMTVWPRSSIHRSVRIALS